MYPACIGVVSTRQCFAIEARSVLDCALMGHAAAREPAAPAWGAAAQAMYRAAQAVSHPGGPDLVGDLVRELADIVRAAVVFVAVFADESRRTLRTLAVVLDGAPLRNFDYPLAGSPCA